MKPLVYRADRQPTFPSLTVKIRVLKHQLDPIAFQYDSQVSVLLPRQGDTAILFNIAALVNLSNADSITLPNRIITLCVHFRLHFTCSLLRRCKPPMESSIPQKLRTTLVGFCTETLQFLSATMNQKLLAQSLQLRNPTMNNDT